MTNFFRRIAYNTLMCRFLLRVVPRQTLVVVCCLVAGCSSTTKDGVVARWKMVPAPASAILDETSAVMGRLRSAFVPTIAPPVVLDFVLDASPGSPGSEKQLIRPSVTTLASVVANLPGSEVRFWSVGDDASRTSMVATVTITAPKTPGRSAVQAHQAKEQAAILVAFDAITLTAPKRSPLLSSIVRIAQESTPSGTRRLLVFASDLLEHSDLGDLECDDPVPSVWQSRLRLTRLFLPDTMRGIAIIAVSTGLRPVANERCPASVAHHERVISLWTTTVNGAGASFTAITGNLTNDDLTTILKPKEQL